jgi:hypothetical protein
VRSRSRGGVAAWVSCFLVAALGVPLQAAEVSRRPDPGAESRYRAEVAAAGAKIDMLRRTAGILTRLSQEPVPARLNGGDRARVAEYDRWLAGAAARYGALADR